LQAKRVGPPRGYQCALSGPLNQQRLGCICPGSDNQQAGYRNPTHCAAYKPLKDKHKKQLIDAGAPEQVVEKQAKELDDLAALEDKQLQQQEAVMKKKEAAALAKAEKEAKEKMDAAADEETRAAVTAQYQKDVAAQKAKHAAGRKAQRGKLNERLAKRKAAMANKHKQELEEKAPQAAVVAEQQEEEREKFDAMKKQLHASQEELAEEKAKHQLEHKTKQLKTIIAVVVSLLLLSCLGNFALTFFAINFDRPSSRRQ